MNLKNDTAWRLRASKEGLVHSEVTRLNLDGSRIHFDRQQRDIYQTLVVGVNNFAMEPVYTAGPRAQIFLNTWLNQGGALDNQQTDRVLINGDVTGQTWLNIQEVNGSPGGSTGTGLAHEGISLVQASGKARADAFVLKGGYVTMNAQPYRYALMAYGPESARGSADASQRLVEGNTPHWDWRLQSEYVAPGPRTSSTSQTRMVRAVAPQVLSYLSAPTAVFRAGLADVRNLHQQLHSSTPRARPPHLAAYAGQSSAEERVFLNAYGGDHDYRSNLGTSDYGVDATVRLSGLQGGGTLYVREGQRGALQVGLAASMGDVTFSPLGVDAVHRTKLEQWSASPYFSWRGAQGAYVDAVLAQGGVTGGVSTALRGHTAHLKGTSQLLSLESGTLVALGAVTVQPQVQLSWQRLKFDHVQDVDGFPVQLGELTQRTVRAGGEVHKSLLPSSGHTLRVYGRAHLTHTLGGAQQVWLGDSFRLGHAGNTLDTGLGIDARLRGDRSWLYGELNHQQRIGSAGNQGWGVTLGVKMGF